MSETLTPNPYSPYADADPRYRHLVPELFGIPLAPGVMTVAACGGMTVVPDNSADSDAATDALSEGRIRDLPPTSCPVCVAVATGKQAEPRGKQGICGVCGNGSSHGDLCALCRQELHAVCQDPAAGFRDQVIASVADAMATSTAADETPSVPLADAMATRERVHAIADEVLTASVAPIVQRLVADLMKAQLETNQLAELLSCLVDPDDPCWFDHHGGCQAHGYLSLEPGEQCPHYETKEILADRGIEGYRSAEQKEG